MNNPKLNEIYGYIYLITNKLDNKVYVGQTTQKGGFDRRYKHNILDYTHNNHLKNAIKKYGIRSFKIEKEYEIAYSKEELDKKEIDVINLLDATNPEHGYNVRDGGSKGKLSEYTKEKLRQINLGKKYSKEVNKKKSSPGVLNPMYGKKRSEEEKRKMSENRKGLTVGDTHPRSKKVICLTTGKEFDCIREAGEYYNIKTYTHISRVCNGELNYCGNLNGTPLRWGFAKPNLKKENTGAELRAKKILCITTGRTFMGQREAGKYYGIKSYGHISECCCGSKNSCGKLPDGTPLRWKYI